MTTGDGRGDISAPNPKLVSTRSSSRQPSVVSQQSGGRLSSQMPPPSRPNVIKPLSSQLKGRSFQGQDRTTPIVEPDPESLFMPQDEADDDRGWDPPNYERDDEEEMLGWDASNDDLNASMRPTVRDLQRPARAPEGTGHSNQLTQDGLAPTQRLSQVSRITLLTMLIYRADQLPASRHVRLMRGVRLDERQRCASSCHDKAGRAASKYSRCWLYQDDLVPSIFDVAFLICGFSAVAMFSPAPC